MMGNCVWDVDTPICKTTGSVLFFKNFAKREPVKTACIRCGKCVRVCSMRLMPTELEKAYDARDTKLLERLKVGVCMECGSCSYVCPAKRNMAEINKLAKVLIKKSKDSKP
jgi:electron transport complex protein RnfC